MSLSWQRAVPHQKVNIGNMHMSDGKRQVAVPLLWMMLMWQLFVVCRNLA